MATDPNTPAELRALGHVLNRVLSGDRTPDLSALPPELADEVQAMLITLRDEQGSQNHFDKGFDLRVSHLFATDALMAQPDMGWRTVIRQDNWYNLSATFYFTPTREHDRSIYRSTFESLRIPLSQEMY